EMSLRFQSSGKLVLAVQDDGVGLPEGLDLDSTHSLGLKMIGDLTRKVRGTLNHFQNNGRTLKSPYRLLFLRGRKTKIELKDGYAFEKNHGGRGSDADFRVNTALAPETR